MGLNIGAMVYICIIMALWLYFVTFIDWPNFRQRYFNDRFKAIYENLDVRRQSSIVYPLIFFVRRAIIVSLFHIDVVIIRLMVVSFIL